jgi:signal transduction histidine kinase/ActR/RegA family two-component response regulator
MTVPRQRTFVYVSIAVVLIVIAPALFLLWRHTQRHTALRAGIRNNSLSTTLNPEGRVDALAVEVLAAAARRSGLRIQWVECPEGPDRALRAKKVDLWPMTLDLPERKKQFHITEPWLAAERCLVTKGPPPVHWNGVTVAYGLGPESQLLAAAPAARPIHAEGDVAAVRAVCAGGARAAYVLMQSLGAFVLRKPEGCEKVDFHITPAGGKPLKLGIGSTFEAAKEADELRIEIGRMAAQGALEEFFNKYSLYSVAETADIYELTDAQRRTEALEFGAGGLILALAVLIWQVDRVREARRTAENANSAKSQFLANMSHELRTPLNGIVAMTEVLGRSGLTPEQRDIAAVILNSSESLMTIVNDILDFSKIEAGGMSIEQIAFDVRATLEDAVRLFTPRAQQKGLEIACRIAADVPRMIVGDPVRIRQILMNLLSNAIKFTDAGGVGVELARGGNPEQGPALLFRVVDTGIGIPPQASAKIFRAFTQADSTTTRKFGGTGLGLAISLRLVTLMGGSIGLESEPGRGSIFWFIVPAPAMQRVENPEAPVSLPAPAEAAAAIGQAAWQILIVEDNPVNQIVAARALRTLGYSPDVASSGEAALDILVQRRFDLILMDCQMPGMDGYQTAAEIRLREAGRRRTPIVAMTANNVDGDRERCVAAGMDDYLSKPFRMAALERALRRWLSPAAERSVA